LRSLQACAALRAIEHAAALVELGSLLREVRWDDAVAELAGKERLEEGRLPRPVRPSTATTVRPERGGFKKSKPSDFERFVSESSSRAARDRSFSSRAICVSFACACLAFFFL
jgi:hypothetical protein